jgi:hypothetical protein
MVARERLLQMRDAPTPKGVNLKSTLDDSAGDTHVTPLPFPSYSMYFRRFADVGNEPTLGRLSSAVVSPLLRASGRPGEAQTPGNRPLWAFLRGDG